LGEACCAAQPLCDANLTCLRGASCSCAKEISGEYLLRVDGVALHEFKGVQTPVIDPASGRAMTGFIDVMSGSGFGCGVRNDGTLWCWGSSAGGNTYGQLGNGTTGGTVSTYRAKQVLVAANTPLVGVAALAHAPAGGTTACAITTGGNLYCWGDLTWVVAGGTAYSYSGYAQAINTNGLTPLANVVHASVTYGGGCALVQGSSTKEVWCWGCNQTNELAQGNTTTSKYPVKVSGLDNPTYIESSLSSSNGNHTNCVIDGGKVRCWGWNPYYSAGGGAAQSVGAPTLIYLPDAATPLSGVTALTSGNETFCALVDNDTVWCWGFRNGGVQYATNHGVTNIVGLGDPESPRFLTSDGKYHIDVTAQAVSCGEL
jgi:alpha-tubulin suppressor-like RCC1 family protein